MTTGGDCVRRAVTTGGDCVRRSVTTGGDCVRRSVTTGGDCVRCVYGVMIGEIMLEGVCRSVVTG